MSVGFSATKTTPAIAACRIGVLLEAPGSRNSPESAAAQIAKPIVGRPAASRAKASENPTFDRCAVRAGARRARKCRTSETSNAGGTKLGRIALDVRALQHTGTKAFLPRRKR